MALFDRYIAVDWSANGKPKRGPDSIWSCVAVADRVEAETVNHPTRRLAESWLLDQLLRSVDEHQRILVGLDFPYGYPAGFARALGVSGWYGIWAYLDQRIRDDAENRSNRFAVAADINALLGDDAPFWGRPASLDLRTLPALKEVRYRCSEAVGGLPEWRAVENRLRSLRAFPQPAWKLAYTGSVGSQGLVGIPVVNRLRLHETLRDVSRVWPFEVGKPTLPAGSAAIIHAEIWPSIVPFAGEEGSCRDEKQVRAVAKRFRQLDHDAGLTELLDVDSIDESVRDEEGWILGVPTSVGGRLPFGNSEPAATVIDPNLRRSALARTSVSRPPCLCGCGRYPRGRRSRFMPGTINGLIPRQGDVSMTTTEALIR